MFREPVAHTPPGFKVRENVWCPICQEVKDVTKLTTARWEGSGETIQPIFTVPHVTAIFAVRQVVKACPGVVRAEIAQRAMTVRTAITFVHPIKEANVAHWPVEDQVREGKGEDLENFVEREATQY